MTDKQKASLSQDVVTQILARKRGMCNILELEGRRETRGKAIYKRYIFSSFSLLDGVSAEGLILCLSQKPFGVSFWQIEPPRIGSTATLFSTLSSWTFRDWLAKRLELTRLSLPYNLSTGRYRYASLFFCFGIDWNDNELSGLEVLHKYVECLDQYFGNVCELDIIYNYSAVSFTFSFTLNPTSLSMLKK